MTEHGDAVRKRFSATAEGVASHALEQVDAVREQVARFVPLRASDRALDVGTGAGTLALALAPLVSEVVGVDLVPALLDSARRAAPPNTTFLEADATSLPFGEDAFDVVCTRRTLHHVDRPGVVVAELARVCRVGGYVFVDDQVAPEEEAEARALDEFERARDPSHARTLPESELRALMEANGLRVVRAERAEHRRSLDAYLALAGCTGAAVERVKDVSPGDREHYVAESVLLLCAK